MLIIASVDIDYDFIEYMVTSENSNSVIIIII